MIISNNILILPCLICFVARESTDKTSTMIFVIIPDIGGENGMLV